MTDKQTSGEIDALAEHLKVRCPTSRTYVRIKVDYTVPLKKRPSRSSESIGFMQQGALLDLISRRGAWAKVRHWNNVVGYVRGSQVETYPGR